MLDRAELISIFYDHLTDLGEFTESEPDQLPTEYRRLLVHQEHMTVAMEAFHESLVDVDVIDVDLSETHYARQSLLRRQRDGQAVQFGIMRVALDCLSDEVREEIEQQSRPLGRVLVRHNILRTVHLDRLWRVVPGPDLQRHLGLTEPLVTYGRTADIELNGRAAVEVLEIPAPL